MFFYKETDIDIHFIDRNISIIQELDRKQRQIRSLIGFFFYISEIIEIAKDYKILKTNLQPSFWRRLKRILRQNKKSVLLTFLFGSEKISSASDTHITKEFQSLKETIESIQNQVNSLHQKFIELEENQTLNLKHALSEAFKRSQATKIDPQGDSILKSEISALRANFIPNDSEVRNPTSERKRMESKPLLVSVSDEPKIDSKALSNSERYNL